MRYRFSQAAHIKGKAFKLGTHEVPEAVETDVFFLKLVKAGLVAEVGVVAQAAPLTPKQRSAKLYDRLVLKGRQAKPAAPKQPTRTPAVPLSEKQKKEIAKAKPAEDVKSVVGETDESPVADKA